VSQELGFEVHLESSFEEAVNNVIAALKVEGFGVLTRIDVKKIMREKLGEEFRPYAIIGACNPPLAHRALSTDSVVGLMLPCNVTVEADPRGGSLVRLANPEMMMQVGNLENNLSLREVATEARTRLESVTKALLEASYRYN